MSSFKGSLAASLPVAVACMLLVAVGLSPAFAADAGVGSVPAGELGIADDGDEPAELDAANGTDAVSDEPQPILTLTGDSFAAKLTVSGSVSRAFMFWNDGAEQDVYFVDPSGTSLDLDAAVEFHERWTAGAAMTVDVILAPADEVDQFNPWGTDNRVEISTVYGYLGHETLGTVFAGLADSATDGIDNIELSESDAVADAGVSSWNEHFLIRPAGEDLGMLRWGDFVDGTLAGDTRHIVGYRTPEVNGFEASAAFGDDFWDAALRYAGEFSGFEVAAGVGYWRDALEGDDEPVDDTGWGGSIAAKHVESGLNIAFNYGTVGHTDMCDEPGLVSGLCRGNDHFYYVKAGVVRDIIEWGPTSFYGEFYRGKKNFNESDEDTLDELLVSDPGVDTELAGSVARVWGLGIVQQIERCNAELFLSYRHYELDVSLIKAGGGAVAAKPIEAFDAVLVGAKIDF